MTLDDAVAVRAVFAAALVRLTVGVAGAGRVVLPGLACARTCSTSLEPRSRVTLTARPAHGARFAGWAGACHGRALRCTVQTNSATAVRARFV